MPQALFYEFQNVSADDYHRVNKTVELDPATGEGDWPAGLICHTGASGPDGQFVVFEVWESKDAQAAWNDRLGPVLGQAGIPAPIRVQWLSVDGHYCP